MRWLQVILDPPTLVFLVSNVVIFTRYAYSEELLDTLFYIFSLLDNAMLELDWEYLKTLACAYTVWQLSSRTDAITVILLMPSTGDERD
jgi:hypothetical protein